jgi:uncharacterized membrane protein YecN with MAPEG domain
MMMMMMMMMINASTFLQLQLGNVFDVTRIEHVSCLIQQEWNTFVFDITIEHMSCFIQQ